ncbi:aminotransferase class I/II-fold pyridoxal phosphate-dependent enzyme [Candidatus Vidania fulgoroideorum]
MIDLSKMEFPYNFIKKIVIKEKINLYPSNNKKKFFIKKIKKFLKIKENILIGNGSDDLIFFLISCYKKNNYKFVGSFYPTFIMYEFYSLSCNIPYIRIKLNNKFDFNLKKTIKFINNKKCGIFFISFPNNPTGNLFSKRKIYYLSKKCKKTIFIIDEAYFFFSKKKIDVKKNIIKLRTFSKIGFAGLRLGVIICNKENFKYLSKKQSPYNMNILSISTFNNFFSKKKKLISIKRNISKIIKERERIFLKLKKKLYKSYGNFFLVKKKYYYFYKKIIKKNIILKKIYFNNNKYFRFSIWKKKTNNKILKILK